jgi:hypothetical protein
MSVYEEFEAELAAVARGCVGRPRQERLKLFLLALGREQLVTVTYDARRLAERVAALDVSEEVRALIRHALL